LQPSYNVCPTDPVDVLLPKQGGGLDFTRMRWGLVPYWWSKPLKQLPATFNARSDTVASKPMFRDVWRRRRCVIPMSGFYEWRQMADGKQPFFISGADAPLLSVAGLWDNWKNRETGETIRSCTMIVTEANPFMSEIHDRMPVFLGQETLHPWLEGEAGTEVLLPASAARLTAWPVSRRVNSSKADEDDRTLVEPVEPGAA
jgi:putative SOS response-associated peptidase YedK